jgi:hypothetical protein
VTAAEQLPPATAKLLREAIVLAHVEGMRYGRATEPGDPYPKDADVVALVLAASVGFRDLYPALSQLDEAKEADAERRRRSIERTKYLMGRPKENQS